MTELDSKSEISLEGDTMLSKLGKLTTSHSPRVIIRQINYFQYPMHMARSVFPHLI